MQGMKNTMHMLQPGRGQVFHGPCPSSQRLGMTRRQTLQAAGFLRNKHEFLTAASSDGANSNPSSNLHNVPNNPSGNRPSPGPSFIPQPLRKSISATLGFFGSGGSNSKRSPGDKHNPNGASNGAGHPSNNGTGPAPSGSGASPNPMDAGAKIGQVHLSPDTDSPTGKGPRGGKGVGMGSAVPPPQLGSPGKTAAAQGLPPPPLYVDLINSFKGAVVTGDTASSIAGGSSITTGSADSTSTTALPSMPGLKVTFGGGESGSSTVSDSSAGKANATGKRYGLVDQVRKMEHMLKEDVGDIQGLLAKINEMRPKYMARIKELEDMVAQRDVSITERDKSITALKLEMMKLNVQLAEATDAAAAAKAAAENAAANANHANAALAALQAAASLGSNVVSATGLSRGATADQAVASLAEAVTVGTGGSSTGSGGAGAGSSSNMGSRAIGGAGADRQEVSSSGSASPSSPHNGAPSASHNAGATPEAHSVQAQAQAERQATPAAADPAQKPPVATITIKYRTSWHDAFLHYAVDGKEWTAMPGRRMDQADHREKTITVEGSRLAFVITNGHGEYDTPPPSPDNPGPYRNYVVNAPGVYRLHNGSLARQ